MVMAQWRPGSKYEYPASMDGGLYCDKNGKIQKPFKGRPNCVAGTATVQAVNKVGTPQSYCQTVLPGREDMLIPTVVGSSAVLAVPGPKYWAGTSAQ